MASDCSGASKRLVEELGGTSAGEALRAPPTGFGATLERYLENGSPSEPKYLKKAPGLPRRSSLRSSFGQASVKLRSFQPHSLFNPSGSPEKRVEPWVWGRAPSEPKYLKKAPGLPRRSSLRSSFGQASVKLRSFHPYSVFNPSGSPGNRLRLWSATNSVTIATYPFQNRKLCTQCFTRTGPTQFRYKAFGCSTAVRRHSAWHAG